MSYVDPLNPVPSWAGQFFMSSLSKEREVKVNFNFTIATENAEGIWIQLLGIWKIYLQFYPRDLYSVSEKPLFVCLFFLISIPKSSLDILCFRNVLTLNQV